MRHKFTCEFGDSFFKVDQGFKYKRYQNVSRSNRIAFAQLKPMSTVRQINYRSCVRLVFRQVNRWLKLQRGSPCQPCTRVCVWHREANLSEHMKSSGGLRNPVLPSSECQQELQPIKSVKHGRPGPLVTHSWRRSARGAHAAGLGVRG